jgi:hypothetical protein
MEPRQTTMSGRPYVGPGPRQAPLVSTGKPASMHGRIASLLALLVCTPIALPLLAAAPAWGQAVEAVDRSMYFIDKAAQATDLLNAGKAQEALPILQELATSYADEDEDGYVGLTLGDCLTDLKRNDEARTAYGAVLSRHPDLQDRVAQKLDELDVSGEITDDAIRRLRTEAQTPENGSAKWRLGRALQKRAAAYLVEAIAAFRSTGEPSLPGCDKWEANAAGHAGQLEDLLADLNTLIQQIEDRWKIKFADLEKKDKFEGIVTEQRRMEQVLRAPDGKRYEIVLRRESQDRPAQITVNGRPLELTGAQRRVLEQHQERVNAVLIQAAQQMDGPQSSQR